MATFTFPTASPLLSRALRTISLTIWRWRTAWVIAGLSVAALGAGSFFNLSDPGTATAYVARTDLAVGTVLSSHDIVELTLDIDPDFLGPVISRPEIIGARLGTPLPAGTLLRVADLVPTDLFAGAPAGMVFTVVTIENAGIISYLRPGMTIDLLSAQSPEQGLGGGVLAQGAIIVAKGADGDLTTSGLNSATPWAQTDENNAFSSTVLVATTAEQSKALALGSHWQGVHAIIVR